MSGLYQRALEIYRQTVGLHLVGRDDRASDMEEVSPEDRVKILRRIDEVIEHNRIRVGEDTFALSAKRSGAGLPLLVNVCLAVLLGTAIFVSSRLFNREEEVLAAPTDAALGAESMLIDALRRDSQARLQEKDREIRFFQTNLQQTLEEQEGLQAERDRTLKEREKKLEEGFQEALAEERRQLLAQGLSEPAVVERLEGFEAQKRAELEAEFAAFRRQTEEAAATREAALADLITEYEKNLQTIQVERTALRESFRQSEERLQEQSATSPATQGSDRVEASARLSRLQEQQRDEQLVRDQILGAYRSVNTSVAQGEYPLALRQLDGIRTYLDQEPALSLPGIQKGRSVELFIVGSLEDLIRSRSARESLDSGDLIEAAERIEALSQGVGRANQLLEAGDTGAARARYLAALEEIPAARAGHEQLSRIQSQGLAARLIDAGLPIPADPSEAEWSEQSLKGYLEALTQSLEDQDTRKRLADLESQYQAQRRNADMSGTTPPEILAELLEAKLLTWRIIASQPVAGEHPGLFDTMDRYLDTLVAQSLMKGRYDAVEDITAVLEAVLNESRGVNEELWRRYSHTDREDMLGLLLDKLEEILEKPGGR